MLPSKSESFGLSALEAMSCGVPVIGTSKGGLAEVVEDSISGYICDPDDIDKMSRRAIAILSGRKKRLDMGRAARKRACYFNTGRIVDKYIDYYKKVLESS
jgi:L-malate glycosyltransferase